MKVNSVRVQKYKVCLQCPMRVVRGCAGSHHPIFADQGIRVKAFAADMANASGKTIGIVKKAG